MFLIRITQAPQSIQGALKVEKPVISHYLQMSIDLLESSDMSETRLGTNLAKTLREYGRAVETSGVAKEDAQETAPVEVRHEEHNPTNPTITPVPAFEFNVPAVPNEYQEVFQPQNELDLSYLLGLTRDNEGTFLQNNGHWSFNSSGNGPPFSDQGFAMGGLGEGSATQGWNGTIDGLDTVFEFRDGNQATH